MNSIFKPHVFFILLAGFLGGCVFLLPVQAEELKVKYKADRIEYIKAEKVFRLLGHVEMQVRDLVITSEKLDYDTENKTLASQVPFEIVQTTSEGKKRTIKGTELLYDIRLKRAEAKNVYLIIPAQSPGQEVYVQGESMVAYEDGKRVVFLKGFYTTCNHYDKEHQSSSQQVEDIHSLQNMRRQWTHYAIEADVLDYLEGDRVLAWNAQILAFEKQTFWFPFWLIPLQSPEGIKKPDIDVGQNAVEGIFTKFKGYYHWNDFHDGYWYATLMQNKGVGLGFQHDWVAFPNSITRFYFYGLPVTANIQDVAGALISGPNAEVNDQASTQLTTQQTSSVTWLDQVANWGRNKFQDHDLEFRHKQKLLPYTELELSFKDKDFYNTSAYQATRNPSQSFEFRLTDNQLFLLDPSSELKVNSNLSLNQSVNGPLDIRYQVNGQNITRTVTKGISGTQNRTASVSAVLGNSNLNLRTNWSENNNSSRTQIFENNELKTDQSASAPSQGNELWNTTLDLNLPFNDKAKLSTNLIYNSNTSGISSTSVGTLIQTLQPRVNLTQSLDWGTFSLNYEDFFTLSSDLQAAKNQSSGQIKKLPELNLQLNPFFQDTFPIQLETRMGRYFDPSIPVQALTQYNLTEIGRTLLRLSLVSKDFDLGMGMKANFGGTNFEQRLYQTQDAEYIFTARANLRNELSPYFIPSLTYERAVQDQVKNNSPFANFEPLQLRTINNLNATLSLVNLPEFTWTFNGGYDYINRQYQQIQSNITSQIGNQFILRAHTAYTPVAIKDSEVGGFLKDSDGYVYRHGDPVNGAMIPIHQEDVGSFSLFGGRWDNTTLGMRWRSSQEIFATGALSTFGLESGIPQGVELGGDIAYDFHLGRINGLNGSMRFSFGDSWLWHTELDLVFSVQPTTIPGNLEELFALVVPFRVVLRKDLHDFILTASWDSFYQQFNLNLSLLAFPFSTSDITGNLGSLNQQVNSLGGGLR
ncbi:hypothetical protein COW36_00705 [bacterium (Candidatus Blackallbacteria) CG17_big_fil_post_rev_8_21_14_2_50_48_46]|uniref:LPS-assembly protein LptD n=1 Tax=bacterium (Candidatus Blackallbacteria) CG17_big_fil_post_rev_8_21_14_2_50_48_46 TaxID=2014261 RepID=A0A2M7GB89_9BACT|nr:MAG: hypothetical protein COW64_10470 [bacterium (Candidatus Blackallbacteria) CG18_big_fil_WC_8_21_14_2_50_49_26]PIW19390.1 MAG: hypothetical protein COW36_00705 [bacterium (Candidatus Blackallbacteria) CG17_big_fil_post_rev_8_21_14_2_50_48_46]PIW49006.1 MAG: hypothetical protein COW20_07750 [bacterium (Candidatus Blackallbacteria) CG13_big_fil_rev_8_21_14_2_50_49_14]